MTWHINQGRSTDLGDSVLSGYWAVTNLLSSELVDTSGREDLLSVRQDGSFTQTEVSDRRQ